MKKGKNFLNSFFFNYYFLQLIVFYFFRCWYN